MKIKTLDPLADDDGIKLTLRDLDPEAAAMPKAARLVIEQPSAGRTIGLATCKVTLIGAAIALAGIVYAAMLGAIVLLRLFGVIVKGSGPKPKPGEQK